MHTCIHIQANMRTHTTHTCTRTYMHACTNKHTHLLRTHHTYIHKHIRVQKHTHAHTYTHANTYTHVHLCTYTRTHTHIHTSTCKYMLTHPHMITHMYTHTRMCTCTDPPSIHIQQFTGSHIPLTRKCTRKHTHVPITTGINHSRVKSNRKGCVDSFLTLTLVTSSHNLLHTHIQVHTRSQLSPPILTTTGISDRGFPYIQPFHNATTSKKLRGSADNNDTRTIR